METEQISLFCFDYDETVAVDGIVSPLVLEALRKLKASGRKLVLVTGRIMPDLLRKFTGIKLCDLIVAENGGTLYNPETLEEKSLTASPPDQFVKALEAEYVPFYIGRTIVASKVPHEKIILRVIRMLGIEYQIIFNKGSLMMLPSGVNKATGLMAALAALRVPTKSVAGIGDGENDHAFLSMCGLSAAVQNAVPSLKSEVDLVTTQDNGAGVTEFIGLILSNTLVRSARHFGKR